MTVHNPATHKSTISPAFTMYPQNLERWPIIARSWLVVHRKFQRVARLDCPCFVRVVFKTLVENTASATNALAQLAVFLRVFSLYSASFRLS